MLCLAVCCTLASRAFLALQDVNNILNSGEVPNLMRPEDLEEIAGVIRPILQAQGRTPTKLAIQAAFVERVQQHLHLVLCMSPVGDAFRCTTLCCHPDPARQLQD